MEFSGASAQGSIWSLLKPFFITELFDEVWKFFRTILIECVFIVGSFGSLKLQLGKLMEFLELCFDGSLYNSKRLINN